MSSRRVLALCLAISGCGGSVLVEGDSTAQQSDELTAAQDEKFNRPGQHHNQVCVAWQGPSIRVRSDIGSNTGYTLPPTDLNGNARKDLLKYLRDPNSPKEPCPDGTLRLDVQEITKTPGGRELVFHRGGYGFDDRGVIAQPANDAVRGDTVHYGMILLEELTPTSQRKVRDALGDASHSNGAACPTLGVVSTIDPKPLPQGSLWYYSPKYRGFIDYYVYADNAHLGAFSLPGAPATIPMSWSWVVNRSGEPNGGGGIERTLLKAGEKFHACKGMKLKARAFRWAAPGANGAEPMRVDAGWVGAVYGKSESGQYGWVMYAFQLGENPVVTMMSPTPN